MLPKIKYINIFIYIYILYTYYIYIYICVCACIFVSMNWGTAWHWVLHLLHCGPVEVPIGPRLDMFPLPPNDFPRQMSCCCLAVANAPETVWSLGARGSYGCHGACFKFLWGRGLPCGVSGKFTMDSYKIITVLNKRCGGNQIPNQRLANSLLACLAYYLTQASDPCCLRHCGMEPSTFFVATCQLLLV